jgi:hypothetical protein
VVHRGEVLPREAAPHGDGGDVDEVLGLGAEDVDPSNRPLPSSATTFTSCPG